MSHCSWSQETQTPQDCREEQKERCISLGMFIKLAHLCVVTPNSTEPDHLACIAEISTSNSSPSFKGRLDSTTPWLKSNSGLWERERERGREREREEREGEKMLI